MRQITFKMPGLDTPGVLFTTKAATKAELIKVFPWLEGCIIQLDIQIEGVQQNDVMLDTPYLPFLYCVSTIHGETIIKELTEIGEIFVKQKAIEQKILEDMTPPPEPESEVISDSPVVVDGPENN